MRRSSLVLSALSLRGRTHHWVFADPKIVAVDSGLDGELAGAGSRFVDLRHDGHLRGEWDLR